jgi:SAM-dependent methyltransferase
MGVEPNGTVAYYDQHAAEFCRRTQQVDMSALYAPFLACLRPGARILDAGCGSGRDSAALLALGYDVVSMDASSEMVAATTALTGRPAFRLRFDEIGFEREFDGIWACASLLHVPRRQLPAILVRLAAAMRPHGVMYASFRYGTGEHLRDGRLFTDLDEAALRDLVRGAPCLAIRTIWVTDDTRDERMGVRWINALLEVRDGAGDA